MLRHANLVVTAWDGDLLVGMAHAQRFCLRRLSRRLASRAHQRQGMAPPSSKTREQMGSRSMLVLLSAPRAVAYYPKMGFTRHEAPGFCAPTSRGQFPPLTVSH